MREHRTSWEREKAVLSRLEGENSDTSALLNRWTDNRVAPQSAPFKPQRSAKLVRVPRDQRRHKRQRQESRAKMLYLEGLREVEGCRA